MAGGRFVARSDLAAFEWGSDPREWKRPPLDREALKELSARSTANGLARLAWFLLLLAVPAAAAVVLFRLVNPWLALAPLYAYWFFYGFWVCIGHELQHRIVFGPGADWFSEVVFFLVQLLMWNSPTYARVSHRLHHRFTMVRGMDPETDWPELITTRWLRGYLVRIILRILVVGALGELALSVVLQVKRIAGVKDRMMREQCTPADLAAIRLESLGILLVHAGAAAIAIVFRRWELLALFTAAWQLGTGFETLWHFTEHVGRPYNVNDHRLNTRSIRVGRFIGSIYWGLDHHVDHHLWPVVPSRNLPRLHALLEGHLPVPGTIRECWAEMWMIGGEKDRDRSREYVPAGVVLGKKA
jgi:fatty acid desaturase